mgnify:CR=1 FL=1
MKQSDLLTLAEAAKQLDMTTTHLARLCAEDRIDAVMQGQHWYISINEVLRIQEARAALKK